MDNLTHTLTGLALSRAGLKRFYGHPGLVLMVAANIPDVDVASLIGGPVSYLEYHRGLTHSIPFLPVMAIFPVLIAMAFRRSRAGWLGAYMLSLIGVASHLLIDWTNSYAIRLMLPFSSTWYHADITGVVDIWIWAILLLAALGPLLSGLVSSEIGGKPGSGMGLAIFALSFFVLYDFGRYVLHERAIASMNARIYEGSAPLRVAAFPLAVNPLRWTGWVDTESTAIRFDMNLALDFDPLAGTKYYKPEPTPAMQSALQTHTFQVFSNFALYPLWTVSPADEPEGGKIVELRDERFSFTATAVVDRANRVVGTKLRF